MARTIIAEKRHGTRKILNTEWPVSSVLYRWDLPPSPGRMTAERALREADAHAESAALLESYGKTAAFERENEKKLREYAAAKASWSVSRNLCNGSADESVSFKREADARAYFDAIGGDLEVFDETEKPLEKKAQTDHFDKTNSGLTPDAIDYQVIAETILGSLTDREELEKAANLYSVVLTEVMRRSVREGLSRASVDATIEHLGAMIRAATGRPRQARVVLSTGYLGAQDQFDRWAEYVDDLIDDASGLRVVVSQEGVAAGGFRRHVPGVDGIADAIEAETEADRVAVAAALDDLWATFCQKEGLENA